jgi:ABC-type uncharacterized transport system substrate-binding protein
MKRRQFITLLGGAAAWPLTAHAQQRAMPVVGFLSSSSSPVTTKRIASFSQGLSETGYVAGRDVMIEPRLAEGQYDRLPALAAELVTRQVNVIAALAPPAAFAAKAATTTIPIVFVGAFDPVKAGLVASLNRPGGNVTGVTFIGASLGAKRLELARELVPNVGVIALLTHPNSPDAVEELRELESSARRSGSNCSWSRRRTTAILKWSSLPSFSTAPGCSSLARTRSFSNGTSNSSHWRSVIASRRFIRPARASLRAA